MHKTYKTVGTCSKEINFDIEDNKIHNVSFIGGCNGNLKAVSSLVEGQDIDTVIKRLKGITCNSKQTSCGDQLATALQEVKNELQ
ncbi:MAG: TIGR03905 family TSCPD domain-containing protein [Mollicutes bacterium]|nr:TIGR03905 family TSCPD domain-containing protein [Mollicutes bacterium]